MLDEGRYTDLATDAFRRVVDAFDDVDVDDADVEVNGGVITVSYSNGSRCVINTQSAVRQIWLAAAGRGWHFIYDERAERWVDDKGTGEHLYGTLRRVTKDNANIDLPLPE